jgi:hypothetical protein
VNRVAEQCDISRWLTWKGKVERAMGIEPHIEHAQDSSSAEAEQGSRLAARRGGAVACLPQFSIMVDLAN